MSKHELMEYTINDLVIYEAPYSKGYESRNPLVSPKLLKIAAEAVNSGYLYKEDLGKLQAGMQEHYRHNHSLKMYDIFEDKEFWGFCSEVLAGEKARAKIENRKWLDVLRALIPEKPILYVNGYFLESAIKRGTMPPLYALPIAVRQRVYRSLLGYAKKRDGKIEIVDGEIVNFDLKDAALNRYVEEGKEALEKLFGYKKAFQNDGKFRIALSESGNYAAFKGKFSEAAQKLICELAFGNVSKNTLHAYDVAKHNFETLFGQMPGDYSILASATFEKFRKDFNRGKKRPPHSLIKTAWELTEKDGTIVVNGLSFERAIKEGVVDTSELTVDEWATICGKLGSIAKTHREAKEPEMELHQDQFAFVVFPPNKTKHLSRPKATKATSAKYRVKTIVWNRKGEKATYDFSSRLCTREHYVSSVNDSFTYSKGEIVGFFFANQQLHKFVGDNFDNLSKGAELLYENKVWRDRFKSPEDEDNRDDEPTPDVGVEETKALEQMIPEVSTGFVERQFDLLLKDMAGLTQAQRIDRIARVAERPFFIRAKTAHVLRDGAGLPFCREVVGYLNPAVLHYIEESDRLCELVEGVPTLLKIHLAAKRLYGELIEEGAIPSPTLRSTIRVLDNLARDRAQWDEGEREFAKRFEQSSSVEHWVYFYEAVAASLFGGKEGFTIDEVDDGAEPRADFLKHQALLVPGTPEYDDFVCQAAARQEEDDSLSYLSFARLALAEDPRLAQVEDFLLANPDFDPSLDEVEEEDLRALFDTALSDEAYEDFLCNTQDTFSSYVAAAVEEENERRQANNVLNDKLRAHIDAMDKKAIFDKMMAFNVAERRRREERARLCATLLSLRDQIEAQNQAFMAIK